MLEKQERAENGEIDEEEEAPAPPSATTPAGAAAGGGNTEVGERCMLRVSFSLGCWQKSRCVCFEIQIVAPEF